MQYRLQYCNEVHYVNSGYSWGAPPQLETWGGGGELPPPPRFLRLCVIKQASKACKIAQFLSKVQRLTTHFCLRAFILKA